MVLRRLTIPNVIANMERLPRSRPRPSSRYFAGDWRAVGEHLTGCGYGGHYDLILSSETIYSVAAQERLLECIKQVGAGPGGGGHAAGSFRGRCGFHIQGACEWETTYLISDQAFGRSAVPGESRSGNSIGMDVLEEHFARRLATPAGTPVTFPPQWGHHSVHLYRTHRLVPPRPAPALASVQLLQPPHGVALVAAKRYYFGVGGGMKSFCSLVAKDGIFETSVVAEVG